MIAGTVGVPRNDGPYDLRANPVRAAHYVGKEKKGTGMCTTLIAFGRKLLRIQAALVCAGLS